MTITRLWQSGWEWGSIYAENTVSFGGVPVIDSDLARTGDYSLDAAAGGVQVAMGSDLTQVRCGLHVYHEGPAAGATPALLTCANGPTAAVTVAWTGTHWVIRCGDNEVIRVADAAFALTQTWHHIGMDLKLHAAAGWVKLTVNGILTVNYSGQTDHGAPAVASLRFGPDSAALWQGLWLDDCYLDDTAGEDGSAVPPDVRFAPLRPTDNGSYSQLAGSDGDSIDNYLLVDDLPPDDEGTYVQSETVGHRDSYTMGTVAVPPGWTVEAVIAQARARKLDAASDVQLKLVTRVGSTDALSAGLPLSGGYSRLFHRQTAQPGGGAWDSTALDTLEMGVEVA